MRPSTDRGRRRQAGQAIVLIAVILVVLFGFLGLAIDGGRGYLDRRGLQSAVDAAALAAAYNYMNNSDYSQAETAATNDFAVNQRLYMTPTCSGYGSLLATCAFNDSTNEVLTISVTNRSIAGVSFTATAGHHIPVTIMQVLGAGAGFQVGATATAVARQAEANGAAILTLSPAGCSGGGNSMNFTGTSTTQVTGDVWSDGNINDNGVANGTVTGNVVDICPTMPPSPLPNFTVSGSQVNGFTMPDPGYPQPALSSTAQAWDGTNGATEEPGTYASDPKLGGGAGCSFLDGGVYTFAAGYTFNGGFVSNEVRPPDEPETVTAGTPNVTTTTTALSGNINSIAINPMPGGFPQGSQVSVGGQTFTTSRDVNAGDTSISISRQGVSGTIPSGSWLSARALPQFWDSNGVGCAATFSVAASAGGVGNPGVNPQTYALELTSVRWTPNGVASCSGPVSPTCYERESAPSMCKTVAIGPSQVIKVSVSSSPPLPGAQAFNAYMAPSGSCQGPFGYVTSFNNSGGFGVTINGNTLSGWSINAAGAQDTAGAPAPDFQGMAIAAGLPNNNPTSAAPPHGDLANEGHCIDTSTGANIACPGAYTAGAVTFFIPGGGNTSTCLNLQGGGDIYVFSGFQYQKILLFEPGPEQAPPANTCLNNVAGHGLTSLIGIFYVPAAGVTVTGGSNYLATIAGGVICWTIDVKGNGGVSISADPSLRRFPSTVRLTQ